MDGGSFASPALLLPQAMWPNYDHQRPSSSYNGGPPPLSNYLSNDSGFAMPTPAPGFPTPQHNYNSVYAHPYASPLGPPSNSGSRPPYIPMPEPQFSSYNPPHAPPSGYRARPGPFLGYGAPPGPPIARELPGQQYHPQHQGGYPNQGPRFNNGHPTLTQQEYGQSNNYRASPGTPPRPSIHVQNYGPHFQDENNMIVRPYFQYSQCNGKKKALFIGINYDGQCWKLKGCINDVKMIEGFIISQYGYKQKDIVTLTDDATDPHARPTRSNILQAMEELVRDAQPHDSLFFHYSGHGGQVKDTAGDEVDGEDEVIYPVDYETEGYIVDNLIHETMVKPLPAGCRLTAIFDSCHSGTAMDLPYVYSSRGKTIKEPNLIAEAGRGLLTASTRYTGTRGNMRQSGDARAMSFAKIRTSAVRKAEGIMKATRTSPADVVSLCSCEDSQLSAEVNEAGQAFGALSYAFITALRANKHQSYQELLGTIRNTLKSQRYSQIPQLSSSHPMDHEVMFIC